jgi:chromosome segregation ATPase
MFQELRASWLLSGVLSTVCYAGAAADESTFKPLEQPAAWRSIVAEALARAEVEQRQLPAAGNVAARNVLDGVQANLAATLALYESEVSATSTVTQASTEPLERSVLVQHNDRNSDRSRNARAREFERREEALRARVERARAEAEREIAEHRRDQRHEGDRLAPGDQSHNDRSQRNQPHPRLVHALRNQQQQIDKVAEQVERLQRRLNELERLLTAPRERPRRENSEADRRRDRSLEDLRTAERERAMREAEHTARRETESRRRAAEAQHEELRRRAAQVEREMQQVDQRHRHTQTLLEQAKQRAMEVGKEVERLTSDLKLVEHRRERLKQQARHANTAAQVQESRLKELDAQRRTRERAIDRDRSDRGANERNARKPPLPDDAI